MKAKAEEENRGQGAADARRWNGLRTIVEARALLKTAFRCASTLKAQVGIRSAASWWLHLEACFDDSLACRSCCTLQTPLCSLPKELVSNESMDSLNLSSIAAAARLVPDGRP